MCEKDLTELREDYSLGNNNEETDMLAGMEVDNGGDDEAEYASPVVRPYHIGLHPHL